MYIIFYKNKSNYPDIRIVALNYVNYFGSKGRSQAAGVPQL